VTNLISEQEKEDLREILSQIYGNNAKQWIITIKSFEVFGELIKNTRECDRVMNYIPRPFSGGNVINWASKQVRQSILRVFSAKEGKHYIICMKTASLRMRSKFEMAQYGM